MDLSRRSFLAANSAALGSALLPGGLLAAVNARTPSLPSLDDWGAVRALFPLSREYLHLSGFFLASHPEPVRAAIEGLRRAIDDNPFLVVDHGLFATESENMQREVRSDLADYLGGRQEDIALTGSTTASLTLVYHGLALGPRDEILTTVHDHFVHHESIRLAQLRNGAQVRKIALFDSAADASVDAIVARVRAGIRPETRVLGVTWVHSSTGIRLPIRAIAAALLEINHARSDAERVLLVVDGVHAIGAVNETISTLGADFFCAGTHKWLFAPRGTGIIWAPAPSWARLRPVSPSFSDRESFDAWAQNRPPAGPTTAARVTPGGFTAFEHQWAMGAAVRLHQRIGRVRIAARITELNQRCKDGLAEISKVTLHTPRDATLSAGVNCFEVEGLPADEVVARLLEKRIIASASPYAVPYARLSAGLMNTPEEVDQAIAAVRAIAS